MYTKEHGLAFLSVYTPDQINAIANAVRTTGDPVAAVADLRGRHPTPFTPLMMMTNVGSTFSADRLMHINAGLTVLMARALTTDFSVEDLAAILVQMGIQGNYAVRIAREIDTDDGASIAFGLASMQRASLLNFLPRALMPAATVTVAGVAELFGAGSAQGSRDVLAECMRLGARLEDVALESMLNLAELTYEHANRGSVRLLPTGSPGDQFAGAAAALDIPGMGTAAGAYLVEQVTRFFEGGDPGVMGIDPDDEDVDLNAIGFTEYAREAASAATDAYAPSAMPVLVSEARDPDRPNRRRKGLARLRNVAKTAKPLLRAHPAGAIVQKAIKRMRESGEPLSTMGPRELIENVHAVMEGDA